MSFSRRAKAKAASLPEVSDNPYLIQNQPPLQETSSQRAQRVKNLQDAQALSKKIDDDLAETKKSLDRRKKAIKILLLGQAESGKSTVLKNFQLAFAPTVFQRERDAWKRIVQLNLIWSVKTILGVLQEEWNRLSASDNESDRELRTLHLRLSPLLGMIKDSKVLYEDPAQGISVRAGGAWKELFTRERALSDATTMHRIYLMKNDPGPLLEASKEDVLALWANDSVQDILDSKGIRMEDSSGFFLDDTPRIACSDYVPTDDDIVRARVRTIGVEEHHFVAEWGTYKGADFFVTDVGGSRSSRASWVPYFDDVNAILFLAPLAFNQMLEEDPTVNRLEDSIQMWRSICENKLLARTTIILFLNKRDILAKTLASGAEVRKYVPSYRDENTATSVTKYFRDRFKHYHRKLSPVHRPFFVYETSAIETRGMKAVVVAVHDSIVRQNLSDSDVI